MMQTPTRFSIVQILIPHLEWMILISSGFREFQCPVPSTLGTPISRFFDSSRIFDTYPPMMDDSDSFGVFNLYVPDVFVHGSVDFPMRLNTDGAGSPPRVPLPTDGPDPVGIS
jgi:hypothetical protein